MPLFLPRRAGVPIAATAIALALLPHRAAHAAPADDIAALQQSIAAMKADYDRRIGALETELRATRAALAQADGAASGAGHGAASTAVATPTPATPTPASTSVPTSTSTPPPTTAAANLAAVAPAPASAPAADAVAPTVAVDANTAPPGAAGAGANAFNPSISLILSGVYAHTSQDPANARITGFALPPGAEIGLGSRGFSLAESELALSASIDPWLAGNLNLSITGDNQISAEEAWIATTALPSGLVLKAGRFFSGRGHGFPGDDGSRNAAGATAFTLHTGGDVGESHSWRAGLSLLRASANDQALDDVDGFGHPVSESFTGLTRVWVADGVWKWAPEGNATRTYAKLQGEWMQSRREGSLAVAGTPGAFRAIQSGGYLQGVWQFMPRWRLGARTEWLDAGPPDYGANAALFAANDYHPTKNSLMLDFSQSEFARFRLQLAQDRSRQGFVDNQVILQYQASLGAHGAHNY